METCHPVKHKKSVIVVYWKKKQSFIKTLWFYVFNKPRENKGKLKLKTVLNNSTTKPVTTPQISFCDSFKKTQIHTKLYERTD